ncbi:MAG TPA: hypothetical protein VHW46_11305 [Terracidiphilus sp.]|nr:hypothetical protein [Terracidiphilus sp.]
MSSRCLYCFVTVVSDVKTTRELEAIETRHICPEKALAQSMALQRTALVQMPDK